jgi:hypothetical protein
MGEGAEIGLRRSACQPLGVLFVALLSAMPGPAWSWGEEGHRIVAEVAARFINPAAFREIDALLREDTLASGLPSHRRSLGEIASWPDEIKAYPWGAKLGAWHFDNRPVCPSSSPANDCPDRNCASSRLASEISTLADRAAPAAARNEALKWVVHLMGDIHQPLHAADNDDQGGNAVEVSFFGDRTNTPFPGTLRLHTIWDVHMVRRLIANRGGEYPIVTGAISDADRASWEQGSIQDWVAESNEMAKPFVYAPLPVPFACGQKIIGTVEIGEDYFSKAAPIIERQLLKAGVRLAKILNEALAPGAEPAPSALAPAR